MFVNKARLSGIFWKAGLVVVCLWLVVAFSAIGGVLWLAQTHPKDNPFNLGRFIPQLEALASRYGVRLQVGGMLLYYDGSPVVKAEDITLAGKDGTLAVVLEEGAVRLAKHSLLLGRVAPKQVEARGLTLRVVQENRQLRIAGFDVGGGDSASPTLGFVNILNGLAGDVFLGRLKSVKVDKANLLLKDVDRQAEWVLEDAVLQLSRYPDNGEQGELRANLRRIYGGGALETPVVVALSHQAGAKTAEIRARFDRVDASVVADYLPPQLTDLFRAKGQIELSTTLDEASKVGLPWVTLKLTDVVLTPPKAYSAPLVFPKLTVDASYEPSPTDVLTLRRVDLVTSGGLDVVARGRILAVTTDPVVNIGLASPQGDVAKIFDLLPDVGVKTGKPESWLIWLKKNIVGVSYTNLRGVYAGRPSDFPYCDDRCGITVDAAVRGGKVQFLENLPPVTGVSGTFHMGKGLLSVHGPEGKVADQTVKNVDVVISKVFTPFPTEVFVSGTVAGDVGALMTHLAKMDEALNLPMTLAGPHVTQMHIGLPVIDGRDTRIDEVSLSIAGVVGKGSITKLEILDGKTFMTDKAFVGISGGLISVTTFGKIDGHDLRAEVHDRLLVPEKYRDILVTGGVPASWLWGRLGKPADVDLVGAVQAQVWVSRTDGGWRFALTGDAAPLKASVSPLALNKKVGDPLKIVASGLLYDMPKSPKDGILQVDKFAFSGVWSGEGAFVYNPHNVWASSVSASRLLAGKTSVNFSYANRKLDLRGKGLDLSGMDLFADEGKKKDLPEGLSLGLALDNLFLQKGVFNHVAGSLTVRNGVWDVNNFHANMPGNTLISLVATGPVNRRLLKVDISNLGAALGGLGLYGDLKGGHLVGNLQYTSQDVASGVLKMKQFEVKNPPFLVKLLGLVSLQQLLAGTDSVLFDAARIPLKLNKNTATLDKAILEGPSMSLSFTGDYDRKSKWLNMDGSLAPALPFNRLVTQIPLLGTLLAGSQEGVLVADFHLKGSSDDPSISVSPLSVVTPGLVKDVWHGLWSTLTGSEKK